MRKSLLTLLLVLSFATAFAQTSDLRKPGYKGSLSLLYQGLPCVGVETSHGAMINQHHYLGAGAGFYVFPDGKGFPSFAEAFLDYHAFILKKDSTPVAGIKVGYVRSLWENANGYTNGYNYKQGLSIQPEFGWSWALGPKYGLSLSAGANLVFPMEKYNKVVFVAPRAAITFEF